jgi:hypothetical protein
MSLRASPQPRPKGRTFSARPPKPPLAAECMPNRYKELEKGTAARLCDRVLSDKDNFADSAPRTSVLSSDMLAAKSYILHQATGRLSTPPRTIRARSPSRSAYKSRLTISGIPDSCNGRSKRHSRRSDARSPADRGLQADFSFFGAISTCRALPVTFSFRQPLSRALRWQPTCTCRRANHNADERC